MSIPPTHLAQEAIAALVDGELPAGPAGRATRHLTGCLLCRMAVQAQREAKEALHDSADVTMPGGLMSRLCAIPFTTDVPGSGDDGQLSAEPDRLTMTGTAGAFAVDLRPPSRRPRAEHARWLRRGVAGTLLGLGASVAVLALGLPESHSPDRAPAAPVAHSPGQQEQPELVQQVVRSLTSGMPDRTPRGGTP